MTNVGAKCAHLQVAGRLRSEDDLEEMGALLEAAAEEEGLDVGVLAARGRKLTVCYGAAAL
eukprot:5140984-Heterocapsa_arctica.AAC.1